MQDERALNVEDLHSHAKNASLYHISGFIPSRHYQSTSSDQTAFVDLRPLFRHHCLPAASPVARPPRR